MGRASLGLWPRGFRPPPFPLEIKALWVVYVARTNQTYHSSLRFLWLGHCERAHHMRYRLI